MTKFVEYKSLFIVKCRTQKGNEAQRFVFFQELRGPSTVAIWLLGYTLIIRRSINQSSAHGRVLSIWMMGRLYARFGERVPDSRVGAMCLN